MYSEERDTKFGPKLAVVVLDPEYQICNTALTQPLFHCPHELFHMSEVAARVYAAAQSWLHICVNGILQQM
jgi:hypothetical protein